LVIVGKDPYPKGAIGIPFVKLLWKDLDRRSAGRNLFESFFSEREINNFKSPREAAFSLLGRGVVLLNASYYFLNRESLRDRHKKFVVLSLRINYPILNKAKHVIVCGKDAKKMLSWVIPESSSKLFEFKPHPSLQGKNSGSKEHKNLWNLTWGRESKKMKECLV